MTSRLGAGKSIIFFYSVQPHQRQLNSFSCLSPTPYIVAVGEMFFMYLFDSEQLFLSQPAPHHNSSWAAVIFMMYLLASRQLFLSQSAAHDGDSWAAVFFMLYLLASGQLLLSQSAAHHGDCWAAVFYDVLTCISAASPVPVCPAPR